MANDTQQKIDLTSAQRLAAAVLIGALTDAMQGDPSAIYWLYSSDAEFWAHLAGYDRTAQLVRVARGCRPGRRMLHGRLNMANYTRALSL